MTTERFGDWVELEERDDVLVLRLLDPDGAYFVFNELIIRIVSHLCWQIESHAQACHSLLKEIFEPAVCFLCGAKTGVLPHGPKAPAIHRVVCPPRIWGITGKTDLI